MTATIDHSTHYTWAEARALGVSPEAFRLAARGAETAPGSRLEAQVFVESAHREADEQEREARKRSNPEFGRSEGLGGDSW